jgi:hypothetical protein
MHEYLSLNDKRRIAGQQVGVNYMHVTNLSLGWHCLQTTIGSVMVQKKTLRFSGHRQKFAFDRTDT